MQELDQAEKRSGRRHSQSIAATLRRLRLAAGFNLGELAQRSNLAPSTLSKIENDQMSPTYDTVLSLAAGLGVEVAELFAHKPSAPVSGRRTVTRKGTGPVLKGGPYDYELLCADIANKKFVPLLTRINAHSIQEFPSLVTHAGEEFIYVLTGQITVHTDLYAPTELNPGDSCYFDSLMGHAVVATSETPATILWVCSTVVEPLRS